MLNYTVKVAEHLFKDSPTSFLAKIKQANFMADSKVKDKLAERINLLKYLEASLRYKSFAEMETAVVKEWSGNRLFRSVTKCWEEAMVEGEFGEEAAFKTFYDKVKELVTNLVYFFFRNSFKLLELKGVNPFDLISQETSHYIITSQKNWPLIHQSVLRKAVLGKGKLDLEISCVLPLSSIDIKKMWVDLSAEANQLPRTTSALMDFAEESRVERKIELLRSVRECLIVELEANMLRELEKKEVTKYPILEKDDIISSLVYCIVKGKIRDIYFALHSLTLLLGRGKEGVLLPKKGVDSYRADIECAVEFLLNFDSQPPAKPTALEESELTIFDLDA